MCGICGKSHSTYPFPSAKLDKPEAVSSARSPCSSTPRQFLTHPNHPLILRYFYQYEIDTHNKSHSTL